MVSSFKKFQKFYKTGIGNSDRKFGAALQNILEEKYKY